MAEEFQLGSGNWWDSSSSSTSATPPLSTPLSSFSWPTDIVDIKNRPSLDSASVSGKYGEGGSRNVLSVNPNLQMMGLGLDWNQSLLRGEMCSNKDHQQEASSHQDHQWGQRIYFRNSEDSSVNDYKRQSVFSSHVTSSNLQISPGSPTNMMQLGVLVSDNHNQTNQESLKFSPYNPNPAVADVVASASWSKFTQLLQTSDPPKQQPQSQLHFSNNTPFWNTTAAAMNDVRSSFFPSLHTQLPNLTVDKKQKMHTTEVSDTNTMAKKISTSSIETSSKRPRNETPSPLPTFKVKKEKMGDRVTALQQLVSPFGKTDTASVLSEATEYIKFLHEQVSALSSPYMKNGASMQHRQSFDKSNEPKQDLRSRGLCLVPVSSTFPVTHETTIDFWTPNSFGGTFR